MCGLSSLEIIETLCYYGNKSILQVTIIISWLFLLQNKNLFFFTTSGTMQSSSNNITQIRNCILICKPYCDHFQCHSAEISNITLMVAAWATANIACLASCRIVKYTYLKPNPRVWFIRNDASWIGNVKLGRVWMYPVTTYVTHSSYGLLSVRLPLSHPSYLNQKPSVAMAISFWAS